MKDASGFVLFTTLIMMLLVSLLVSTSMQHLLVYQKSVSRIETRRQNLHQMEVLSEELARREKNLSCIESSDVGQQVIEKLEHNQGCSITKGQHQFRYLIEDLGDFPCLIIPKISEYHATHHRRVTLMKTNTSQQGTVLQIRYATPIPALACDGLFVAVREGVISWRYLSS